MSGPNRDGNLTVVYGVQKTPEHVMTPPEIARYAPWRILGTNLVDFSPIIAMALRRDPPQAAARYLVEGTVLRAYIPTYLGSVNAFRPEDLTRSRLTLVEAEIGGHWILDPNGYAETISLSPGKPDMMAHHYVPTGMKWVEEHADCLVSNAPPVPVGARVQWFAWPCRRIQWPDSQRNPSSVQCFDFGQTEVSRFANHPVYLRVTTNGVQTVRSPFAARAVTPAATVPSAPAPNAR